MRSSYVSVLSGVVFSMAALISGSSAVNAQVAGCPAGYTCTPIQVQQVMCPTGFTCMPVATNINMTGTSVVMLNSMTAMVQPTITITAVPASAVHPKLPGIRGYVSALNEITFMVNGSGLGLNATTSINVIPVPHATIVRNNATSTINSIAYGDKVFIQGTLNGTTIMATLIRARSASMAGSPAMASFNAQF